MGMKRIQPSDDFDQRVQFTYTYRCFYHGGIAGAIEILQRMVASGDSRPGRAALGSCESESWRSGTLRSRRRSRDAGFRAGRSCAAAKGCVLFNVAGLVLGGTLADCTDEEWQRTIDVNLKSMFLLARAAVPEMVRQGGGSIVNMASVAGPSGVPNRGAYSVSKAGVIGLTKSLAADFVKDGIRCNCICPGTVDTPSLRGRIASAPDPEAARRAFIARQPMGRLGRAEEVAALALFLASDDSRYMTGQALVMDGGMTL